MMLYIAVATSPENKEARAFTEQGLRDLCAMWPHYNWKFYKMVEL